MTGQEEELVPASPACRPQRCGMSRWPPAHRAPCPQCAPTQHVDIVQWRDYAPTERL